MTDTYTPTHTDLELAAMPRGDFRRTEAIDAETAWDHRQPRKNPDAVMVDAQRILSGLKRHASDIARYVGDPNDATGINLEWSVFNADRNARWILRLPGARFWRGMELGDMGELNRRGERMRDDANDIMVAVDRLLMVVERNREHGVAS